MSKIPNEQVPSPSVYRILDANLNRLREALRVIEEYFRFIDEKPAMCDKLKLLRHELIEMEAGLGRENLLTYRNTESDCFAGEVRSEEKKRGSERDVAIASFKRAQEAARVLEEYAKVLGHSAVSQRGKTARFSLYDLEKRFLTGNNHG